MRDEFKRPLKRPKKAVNWRDLFYVNSEGKLYLPGCHKGKWKEYLTEEYLSENYQGPWPSQDSYAFIIDLSKGCALENLGWMTQNPDYRAVKDG
jgi:hypothetical protein